MVVEVVIVVTGSMRLNFGGSRLDLNIGEFVSFLIGVVSCSKQEMKGTICRPWALQRDARFVTCLLLSGVLVLGCLIIGLFRGH